MKKRVLSLLLCVCLVLGMLPSGIAFAVNGETAGELAVDEEGKADCPVCGPVTWTAISGNSAGTQNLATIQDGEHHHYYLSADINAKNIANQYLNLLDGSKLCLHLNGHTLTHGGYIYVGGGSLLNIMGAGNVTFTDTNTGNGYDNAGLYIANSTLNLYSGNYSVAENAITTGKPMICQTGTSATTVKNAVVSGQTLIKQGTLTLDETATFENIQVETAGKLVVESTWTGDAQANFAAGLTNGAVPAANASAEMGFTGTLTMPDGTELLADENGTVLASSLNSSLYLNSDNKALCPVCKETVTWTPISSNASLGAINSGHHHMYLTKDIDARGIANQYLNLTSGAKLCLHLNGHNLTYGGYIFVADAVLNIMGDGNMTFTDTNTGNGYDNAGLYIRNSTVNLYGGTYSVAENAITTGKPTIYQEIRSGTACTVTVKDATVNGLTDFRSGTLTLDKTATFENIQVAAAGKLIVESTWTGDAQANFAAGLTNGAVPAANASAEMGFTGTLTMQDGTELLADENGTVLASSLNSSLYLNSDNKALCPVCKETVTWTPISSNASLEAINSGHHHMYLTKDIDARGIAKQYLNLTNAAKLCLHLNGHTLTYGGYIFVSDAVLNIMGTGNMTFTDTNTAAGYDQAGLYIRNSEVNLYGGTYGVAEAAETNGKPTIYQEIRSGTACTVNVKNATVNGLTDFRSGTLTLDEAATFENIQVAAAGKLIVESTWTGDAQANFAAGLTNGAVPAANASAEMGFTGTLTMPNGSELIAEDGLLKCSHNYGEGVVTPPTCEAGGYTTYTCKDCGHSYTDAETEATNHAWGDWEKISDTEHKRVCANDASHTETAGHNFEHKVVDPNFGSEGYTEHTCSDCGYSYKDNYQETLVAVAEIVNGDKFTTLDAALAAAQSGDTVKLLKDATITDDVTLAAGVTYEIPADAVLTVAEGASVVADAAATLNCYGTIVVAGNADISDLVYGEGKTFGACGGKLTVKATGNVKMLASWEKIWTPANDATIHANMLKDCETGAKISVGSQNWELRAEGWEHTNHVYVDTIVPPTFDAAGYTEHTCACGDSYQDTPVDKKIPTVEVNGTKYETIEEVLQAGGEIKLLKDHEITLTDDVTIDLNGFALTAELNGNDITVKGEGTFAGSDAANDSYDASACGKITLLDGATIDIDNTVNGVRYIAVKNADETYSYHRLDVTVKHVTIRTTEAGLYYKSAFKADDVLLAAATKYGVVLSLSNMPGANWDEDGTDINVATEVDAAITPLEFDKVVTSGSVFGIMKSSRSAETNARYGKMYIYANPYLVVDGNVIMCDTENVGKTAEADGFNGVAYSLFSALKKVNDNWNNTDVVKEENKPAFKAYYDKWATIGMNLWADELPNISSYAAQ